MFPYLRVPIYKKNNYLELVNTIEQDTRKWFNLAQATVCIMNNRHPMSHRPEYDGYPERTREKWSQKKKKVELMRCILIIFASSRMLLMMGYYRTAFKNLNTWSNIIDSPLQGQGPFQGQSTLHTRPTSPCAWSHGFCIMTNWFRREQSGVWLNGRSHQLTTDMCMLYKLPYDMCRLG